MKSIEQKKITVSLPKYLLKKLAQTIAKRKRSDFISQAIEEKLALIEQNIAVNESVGINVSGLSLHPPSH